MIPHSKPWITAADEHAVQNVLASGMLAQGQTVQLFEKQVAAFTGYNHALAVPSGTAALVFILQALGVKTGDEVILPTYVCKSVADAVVFTGATPVLCDISGPWCMTPDDVQQVMTPCTRAVVLVHTFGISASDFGFNELGVPVIDDYCQAFGLNPDPVSGSGLGFCSFNATKCFSTGEGGMVLVNDAALFATMQQNKRNNQPPARFSDLQAALGLAQLERYPQILERRKAIAKRYLLELDEKITQNSTELDGRFYRDVSVRRSVFFRFPIMVPGNPQDHITAIEQEFQIALRRGVDALLHNPAEQQLPGAEKRFAETLSIPVYPALTDEEVTHIIRSLNTYFTR